MVGKKRGKKGKGFRKRKKKRKLGLLIQSLRAFRLAKIRSYEDWMIGGLEEWKSLGGLEDGKDCNIGRPCLAMFWGSERDGKSTKLARNRLRGATID